MIQPRTHSSKELLWLNCKEKRCCSYYSVSLTGLDIWRISQVMQLPPSTFTVYTDAEPDSEYGFSLDASGKRYQVILAKHQPQEQSLSPCIFLWRLPDGHAQCGLGELRPSVCKSYPSTLINNILCMGDHSGCSCRTWALAQVEAEVETRLVQRLEQEWAEYRQLVQAWNQRVQQAGRDRQFSYMEFCSYLINTYADRYQTVEKRGEAL